MKKEDIVRGFLRKGHLLSPDALLKLENEGTEKFLGMEFDSLVIQKQDLSYDSVKIIKNITEIPNEITKQDFIDAYKKKYDTIKEIFVRNQNKEYTSFSNLKNGESYNVIGIVKEIKEDGKKLVLEDATGNITIVSNKEKSKGVNLDDVVGVDLVVRNGVKLAKSITFPDFPLRSPKTSRGRVCCLTNLKLGEAPKEEIEKNIKNVSKHNPKYVFILSEIKEKEFFEELIEKYLNKTHVFHCNISDSLPSLPVDIKGAAPLSDPCVVEINGVNILCSSKATLENLKKRYIPYDNLPHECFIVDKNPDIVFYPGEEPFERNYKSMTMVTAGNILNKFGPKIIDLGSREIETLG